MWIKHNNIILNTDDISYIEQVNTRLMAHMKNDEVINIGMFKSVKESRTIFSSITSKLLFDKGEDGIIIKDTREVKKSANRKSN